MRCYYKNVYAWAPPLRKIRLRTWSLVLSGPAVACLTLRQLSRRGTRGCPLGHQSACCHLQAPVLLKGQYTLNYLDSSQYPSSPCFLSTLPITLCLRKKKVLLITVYAKVCLFMLHVGNDPHFLSTAHPDLCLSTAHDRTMPALTRAPFDHDFCLLPW